MNDELVMTDVGHLQKVEELDAQIAACDQELEVLRDLGTDLNGALRTTEVQAALAGQAPTPDAVKLREQVETIEARRAAIEHHREVLQQARTERARMVDEVAAELAVSKAVAATAAMDAACNSVHAALSDVLAGLRNLAKVARTAESTQSELKRLHFAEKLTSEQWLRGLPVRVTVDPGVNTQDRQGYRLPQFRFIDTPAYQLAFEVERVNRLLVEIANDSKRDPLVHAFIALEHLRTHGQRPERKALAPMPGMDEQMPRARPRELREVNPRDALAGMAAILKQSDPEPPRVKPREERAQALRDMRQDRVDSWRSQGREV